VYLFHVPPFTNGFHVRSFVVFGAVGVFFLVHAAQTLTDAARRSEMITALVAGAAFCAVAAWSGKTLITRRSK
jgi:hypothetical protein